MLLLLLQVPGLQDSEGEDDAEWDEEDEEAEEEEGEIQDEASGSSGSSVASPAPQVVAASEPVQLFLHCKVPCYRLRQKALLAATRLRVIKVVPRPMRYERTWNAITPSRQIFLQQSLAAGMAWRQ